MSSPGVNRFSAAGSALGYLAQVEYALLIALERMDGDVELRLSIETADDIEFDVDGTPRESRASRRLAPLRPRSVTWQVTSRR